MPSLSDLRCVERWQLEGWIRAHRIATKLAPLGEAAVDTFCNDCLPEYRREMLKEGRCIRG